MSDLPAFQFYPGDWRKHVGTQALDYHTRGVWLELLCLMHESDERGRLLLGGRPMSVDALAGILGLSNDETQAALNKLEDYGVADRDEDGALLCRRMVRDERTRQAKSRAGRIGGLKSRPPKHAQATAKQNGSKREAKYETTKGSSSSSSSKRTSQFGGEVEAVFGYWAERRAAVTGKTSGPPMQLTDKRASRISGRLDEGYSVPDLRKAIDGCLANPHNLENGYLDVELVCRDQQHVEQYLTWSDRRERSKPPKLERLK